MAIFTDERVGKGGKFAHDGGQRELGLLARGAEPAVEGFQVRIAAGGGDRRHVKRGSDMGAPALDTAQAPAVTGIVVEGSDAGESCDFLSGKQSELGQARGERRGHDRPDALDRGEDAVTAFQGGIALKQHLDGRVQRLDRLGASVELALQDPPENLAFSGRMTVLERGLIGFSGLPRQNKLLKLRQCPSRDRRGLGTKTGAIERQKPRIDLVRLGKLPQRLGELTRPQRIDNGNRISRRAEHKVGKPVQFARRLHDGQRHLGTRQLFAQRPDAIFAVGNAETLASWMQMDVEPRFTDVNAHVNCAAGSYGCYLALHAGLAPQSSVQTMSRRADGPSSPASQKLKGTAVPPARLMRDGHPS